MNLPNRPQHQWRSFTVTCLLDFLTILYHLYNQVRNPGYLAQGIGQDNPASSESHSLLYLDSHLTYR